MRRTGNYRNDPELLKAYLKFPIRFTNGSPQTESTQWLLIPEAGSVCRELIPIGCSLDGEAPV